MSNVYAIIETGVVINTIIADEWPGAVNITHLNPRPGVGWKYVDGLFDPPAAVDPEPEPVVELPRHITNLAFDNRFTRDERVDIELAALVEPGMTIEAKRQAMALQVDLGRAKKATYIDLDRPDTRAGVQQFEIYGLIGPGRALEILDAPIQDHERFRG